MKHYYAICNHYGTPVSTGFAGLDEAYIFNSKSARDSFVLENRCDNLSIEPLSSKHAYRLCLTNPNGSRVFWSPEKRDYVTISKISDLLRD